MSSDSGDSSNSGAEGQPLPHLVGYRQPPVSGRFKAGQSGNPKGRPRGRRTTLPYETVLGQLVTIREEGDERQVTAAEAFLLHMTKSGLAGNGPAGRAALAAIEAARAKRGAGADEDLQVIIVSWVAPEHANQSLEPLRMATKVDPFGPDAQMLIEPWLVTAALARLGERRLSLAEQAEVWRATRTPHKVKWPDWWELSPKLLQEMAPSARVSSSAE